VSEQYVICKPVINAIKKGKYLGKKQKKQVLIKAIESAKQKAKVFAVIKTKK
jgi:hypothetical protein